MGEWENLGAGAALNQTLFVQYLQVFQFDPAPDGALPDALQELRRDRIVHFQLTPAEHLCQGGERGGAGFVLCYARSMLDKAVFSHLDNARLILPGCPGCEADHNHLAGVRTGIGEDHPQMDVCGGGKERITRFEGETTIHLMAPDKI